MHRCCAPLFYITAVISPISARSEGQPKAKVYRIILFISIFLWVPNAKWLICPGWGEQKEQKAGLRLKFHPTNTEGMKSC